MTAALECFSSWLASADNALRSPSTHPRLAGALGFSLYGPFAQIVDPDSSLHDSMSRIRSLATMPDAGDDPNFQKRLQLGRELVTLFADSLTAAPSAKSYPQLYTKGLSLQFLSNLRAALVLISQSFDSETWILGRSMAELLIRVKWVHKKESNAVWMILGTELADLNRFSAHKISSRHRNAAIAAINQRFSKLLPTLSKKGRFWHKTLPNRVRKFPTIEVMAEESGMLKLYRGFFQWGSWHTHASHRVLERFMVLDADRNFMGSFVLKPIREDLSFTTHHILCITIIFLGLLRKYGYPVNDNRFQALGRKIYSVRPANI
jgi:uncharacterized protein DUF5677